MSLSDEQVLRYSRHILLKDVGGVGQEKLLASRVLIVGAGGLGSPIALYLAAGGVGHIGIIDDDQVDLTNLQRQIIHYSADVGRPKVESAREKILQLNPDVEVKTYRERLTAQNAFEVLRPYDFIVEGTDNFTAKFLVNDACVLMRKPFSQGGILRFEGQTMTHVPGSACYRCVFDAPPPRGAVPSCSEAGVLGAVAGMLGTIQATETLRYLLGIGKLLVDRMLFFDARDMEMRTVTLKRNPACPVCGDSPTIRELREYEQPACDLPTPAVATHMVSSRSGA